MSGPGNSHGSLTGITTSVQRKKIQEEAETVVEISRRLAALVVRRQCHQHQGACTGGTAAQCSNRNHVNDADYLNHCLSMLGLDGTVPIVTEEDRATLVRALKQVGSTPDLSDLDVHQPRHSSR